MTPEQMRRAAGVLEDLEYFNLARLLREQAEAMGWRDIATAPRDGTEIDVVCSDDAEGYRVTNAWWCVTDRRWRCYTDGGLIWTSQPTHWQPLPPAAAAAGREVMRWRYQPVIVDTEGTMQLCEVHIDDADALALWSDPAIYPSGDDLMELTADLMRMTVDAYSWRPVPYSSLVPGMKFERAITMEQREALASLTESVAHNCKQAQMARGDDDA